MAFAFAGQYGPEAVLRRQGVLARLLPGEPVSVVNVGTNVVTVLYDGRSRTAVVPNPTLVDAAGNLTFFAEPGTYDLLVGTARIEDVVAAADPEEENDSVYLRAQADLGATGDGVTVDGPAIRAGLDALAVAGGGVLFFERGTYVIDKIAGGGAPCLYVGSNITLDGAGKGASKLLQQAALPSQTVFILTKDEGNVTIRSLTIDGNADAQTNAPVDPKFHGVMIRGNTDSWVIDCEVKDNAGDGIYFGYSDVTGAPATDCGALRCLVRRQTRHGIDIAQSADHITIRDNVVRDVVGVSIHQEPVAPSFISNVLVENNRIYNTGRDGVGPPQLCFTLAGGSSSVRSKGMRVRNNWIFGGAVHLYMVEDVVFEGNRVETPAGWLYPCVTVRDLCIDITIENNYLLGGASTGGGTEAASCVSVWDGITEQSGRNVTIRGNTLHVQPGAVRDAQVASNGCLGRLLVEGNSFDGENGLAPGFNFRTVRPTGNIVVRDNHFRNGYSFGIGISPEITAGGDLIDSLEMSGNTFVDDQVVHSMTVAMLFGGNDPNWGDLAIFNNNFQGIDDPISGLNPAGAGFRVGANQDYGDVITAGGGVYSGNMAAIYEGWGSPEGARLASRGSLYIARETGSLWIKKSDTGAAGWVLVG